MADLGGLHLSLVPTMALPHHVLISHPGLPPPDLLLAPWEVLPDRGWL